MSAKPRRMKARYAYPHDHAKTVDKDHGRIEVRQVWTIHNADLLARLRTVPEWPHLTTLVKVQAERYVGDENSLHTRYYISSAESKTSVCALAGTTTICFLSCSPSLRLLSSRLPCLHAR